MAADIATPSSAKSNHGAIVVEWKNLGLKVDLSRGKDKSETVEKHILKGVSGNAQPGELLAIMGPSGAGKTSLLNCLAGRTSPTSGTTLFNGMEMQDGDRQSLAYVHQQEMLLPGVTPKEHLTFQSTLRMDGTVPKSVRQEKIAQAISLLGLDKCQNQLVGDIYSGLSKSEKRRVSFATEILSDPRVLFADEPTTGLDSAMAEIIVKYMRSLAQKGRSGEPVTVMATIHQPSSEVFRLFDKLCLVLDGQVGYMGPAAELVSFLSKLNFEPASHTPPAEFMMDICIDPKNNDQAMKNREAICSGWASKAGVADAPGVALEQKRSAPKQQSTYKAPLHRQVVALTHRDILLLLRSRTQRVKICVYLVFGIVFGLTYFQLEIDSTAVLTLNQAMFLSFMMCCFTEGLFACLGLPEMIPTLIREHRNGAYSPLAIYISRTLADMPFIVISSLCWSSLLYWMIGFREDFENFVKFAAVLLVMAFSAAGIGYFAVFAVPIGALATLVIFLNILPFMLFGGLFVNFNSIPTGFMWLKEISMFRYGYAAIMINQWEDYGPMNIDHASNNGFEDGRAVLDFFGINTWETYGMSLIAIGIVGIIYRTLALLMLLKRAKPRQFDGAAPEDDTKGTMGKEDEAPTSSSNVPAPELSLEWHGLCVKGPGATAGNILEGCSGAIPAGNLVAIMGPSGSGKSTLLKTLANVAELPLSSGEVLVNGAAWSEECRKFCCYLHQDETFFGNLTVREHLQFQCQLRIGRLSAQERQQRIDKWIAALGLVKCEHTLIGEIGSGISGGERKRLAFAAEVVMDPALLFVDEPTSGLDSSMARNVIQLLQDLSHGQDGGAKRTILASIHQPSAKVYAMFDKLVLLQNGRTVYFGPAAEVGDHFASLGYVCPQDVSVSDFVMRRVTASSGQDDAEQPEEVMQKLVKAVKAPEHLEAGDKVSDAKRGDLTSSTGAQVLTLVRREGLIRRRSKLLFKAMIARALFMNLLLGLLYFQIEHDQAGVQSTMGAVTVVMINTFMTSGFGLALEIPSYIPAAIRESKQGMYSLTAWYWAKTLNDLPLDGLISSIGMTIAFWLIGFKNDGAAYLTFILAAVVLSWAGNGWGYMCAIAGVRSEFSVGLFFFSVFPMITFSGFMVVSEDIPDYFKWLEAISFFRYLYSELVITVWDGYGSIGCDAGRCPYPSGQAVLDFFGIITGKTFRNWSILVGYVVAARLAGWGILVWRGRNSNGALCPKRA